MTRKRKKFTDQEPGAEMPAEHKPTVKTRAEVAALTSYGMTQEEIGKYLGVTAKTLAKHYRNELETGKLKANAKVAAALFKQATKGNFQAQRFWLMAQADWKEKKDISATIDGEVTAIAIVSKGQEYNPDDDEEAES